MAKLSTKHSSLFFYLFLTTFMVPSLCVESVLSHKAEEQIEMTENCSDCPPWTLCQNKTCICRKTDKTLPVKCSSNNLQLIIKKCNCATFDNQTKKILTGSCIEGCSKETERQGVYFYLSSDPQKINTFMCEKQWNRTGRLCGKCLPGYAPLAYSYDMRCIKCPEGIKNIWKYILLAYGPLTLFYFVVLFFKINATTSHLHGFFHYSQVISIPAFLRVSYISIVGSPALLFGFHALVPIYSIWSLDILRGLQLEICLDVSFLTLTALNWGLAMYPLLLSTISYFMIELYDNNYKVVVWLWKPFCCIFAPLKKNWNVKNSVIDAYVTFFLMSFVKLLNISIDILTPSKVTELTSGNSTLVLYYDGTVDYFGATHLPYAIVTIFIGLIMIVGHAVLLVLYPFKWFQRLLLYLRIKRHILQTVMDSFQGCYKDGTEPGTQDYRWFAAIPIIGHLICFFLLPFTLDSSFFSWATVIAISLLLLTVFLQPYKKKFAVYTKIDCIFLAFLAITSAMIDGKNISGLFHPSLRQTNVVLLGISFVAPILYMTCITLYWIVLKMKQSGTWLNRCKAQRKGYADIEEDFPDRLVHPQHYQGTTGDLLDNFASNTNITRKIEDTCSY